MKDPLMREAARKLRRIPAPFRLEIAEWLHVMATKFDVTGKKMRAANRKIKEPSVEASAAYWDRCASCASYLATIVETIADSPGKRVKDAADVDSK